MSGSGHDGGGDGMENVLKREENTVETPVYYNTSNSNSERSSVDVNDAQDFHQHQHHSSTTFFADAVLDLEEAHDIAETPPEVPKSLVPKDRLTAAAQQVSDLPHHRIPPGTPRRLVNSLSIDDGDSIENGNHDDDINNDDFANGIPADPPIINKEHFSRIESNPRAGTAPPLPPRSLPRWPRDVAWSIVFLLFVPLSFFWPVVLWHVTGGTHTMVPGTSDNYTLLATPLARHPLSTATVHCLLWTTLAAWVLSRLLYCTSAGRGDGDDARHWVASALTATAGPISVAVYVLLTLQIYTGAPRARWACLVPIYCALASVFLFRRWQRRGQLAGTSDAGTRQAFFQALVCMALDVLNRSLRRASFYRVLFVVLAAQTAALLLWRWALLAALSCRQYPYRPVLLAAAFVGGKWATGTVARMLSLLACGGVSSWFVQQSQLLQRANDATNNNNSTGTNNNNNDPRTVRTEGDFIYDDDLENEDDGIGFANNNMNITDAAYRTVDASVYQSVLPMDDLNLDDDDYEIEDDELLDSPSRIPPMPITTERATVKSILAAGMTVSFGSVAQCGLLGGLAQFVWSQLRKAEAAKNAIAMARAYRNGRNGARQIDRGRRGGEFRGMHIGGSGNGDDSASSTVGQKIYNKINAVARMFVRNHSDLAMSHVAVYYKSYQRAARDVAVLIDETGVEPILHADITTHMCSCVCGSVSGIIVLLTTHLALYQQYNMTVAPGDDTGHLSDAAMVENMLLAFVLSYTLISTVMEPLRASIKAVYVSFAQYPHSLSQSFPLIFHRLSRLSESNLS